MTLQEWVDSEGITAIEGARRCDLPQNTFHQYMTGRRKPRDQDVFAKILKGTGGSVTPNDFYGIAAGKAA